jgi:hypothetical protein
MPSFSDMTSSGFATKEGEDSAWTTQPASGLMKAAHRQFKLRTIADGSELLCRGLKRGRTGHVARLP